MMNEDQFNFAGLTMAALYVTAAYKYLVSVGIAYNIWIGLLDLKAEKKNICEPI
jgi:hypothetical protein